MSNAKKIAVEPTSVSSIFRVLDNRIVNAINKRTTPTTSTKLLYIAGSDLTPVNLGRLSN